MPNTFVIRICYTEPQPFRDIRDDLLRGNLRQGWAPSSAQNPSGADLRKGRHSFVQAWRDAGWGNPDSEAPKRYDILSPMLDIQIGDRIIIPKVSKDNPSVCRYFTIAICVKPYEFASFKNYNDFGHIIGVDVVGSWSYYSANPSASTLGQMLSTIAYSRAVNRVNNFHFAQAVEDLIRGCKPKPVVPVAPETVEPETVEPEIIEPVDKLKSKPKYKPTLIPPAKKTNAVDSLIRRTYADRKAYLQKILERLEQVKPSSLEEIIMQLFAEHACKVVTNNNGKRFLICELFPKRTLMHDICKMNFDDTPKIIIKVNPHGVHFDDFAELAALNEQYGGGNQMMLINLNGEFDEETLENANEHGVILIDGMMLAELLVSHGIGAVL